MFQNMRKGLISLWVVLLVNIFHESNSQSAPLVIPLWENGAPGFESRKNEQELSKWLYIQNLNLFLPKTEQQEKDIVEANGKLVIKNGKIAATSVFTVLLADYKISIPGLVADKVSKSAKIIVNCLLDPLPAK